MSAMVKNTLLATNFISALRGGSQPILVQASNGLHYVVKFTNNLQGANLPFNESMGNELYRACGLAVPSWRPLLVTDAFIDRNPDCWMHTESGRFRPGSGLCFGTRFLGSDETRVFEILSDTRFKRVRNLKSFWLAWLVDICARHSDNRQAIFQEGAGGWLKAFFIDHGHLFGGPKGEHKPRFMASRYLDPRIYQSVTAEQLLIFQKVVRALDVDRLWQRTIALPQDWKTESGLSGLTESLDRLSDAKLLQNVLDTMADAHQRTNGLERKDEKCERKLPGPVLCLGAPARWAEQQRVADRADNLCCA
jgi:hypothetical protein